MKPPQARGKAIALLAIAILYLTIPRVVFAADNEKEPWRCVAPSAGRRAYTSETDMDVTNKKRGGMCRTGLYGHGVSAVCAGR